MHKQVNKTTECVANFSNGLAMDSRIKSDYDAGGSEDEEYETSTLRQAQGEEANYLLRHPGRYVKKPVPDLIREDPFWLAAVFNAI